MTSNGSLFYYKLKVITPVSTLAEMLYMTATHPDVNLMHFVVSRPSDLCPFYSFCSYRFIHRNPLASHYAALQSIPPFSCCPQSDVKQEILQFRHIENELIKATAILKPSGSLLLCVIPSTPFYPHLSSLTARSPTLESLLHLVCDFELQIYLF